MNLHSVANYHKTTIAKQTLRLTDVGASIIGGPTKEESRKILREDGWSAAEVHVFEHSTGVFGDLPLQARFEIFSGGGTDDQVRTLRCRKISETACVDSTGRSHTLSSRQRVRAL